MKNRNEYFDFLRGIAIIFVVGIHTIIYTSGETVFEINFKAYTYQALLCAVPIFLSISGFFLSKIDFSSKDGIYSFWRKQIPKIYLPCLIWSIPLFAKAFFYSNYPLINCLVYYFLCGLGVFYFVSVIIQLYLLLPFIKKLCNKKGVIFFAFVSLAAVFMINIAPTNSVLSSLGVSILWIGFFALGIYLSKNTNREYSLLFAVLLMCGYFLNNIEIDCWESFNRKCHDYKLSSFLYSFGVILLLFSKKIENLYHKKQHILKSAISYIGKISFGIYLVLYPLTFYMPFKTWIANWVTISVVSIFIIIIAKRLFPIFSKKYLGFY
jgi:peptidoglycan/LPS O-acetylase OafA/YrhL